MDSHHGTRDSTLSLLFDWIRYLRGRRLFLGFSARRANDIAYTVAVTGNPTGC
jgi:hypothetical protein